MAETQIEYLESMLDSQHEQDRDYCQTEAEAREAWSHQQVIRQANGLPLLEPYEECGYKTPADHPDPDDEDGRGPDELDDEFADPLGVSALRAATPNNPRNLPCPTCGSPNRLTPKDQALGYQCDSCADRLERGGY